uniref:FAS-associated factor 2 n=1 Tax=Lynx canadensis TaxID=61383 RepID=A0A667GRX4_LYNCA
MAAPEERDLTQEQTEKLLQFQDLTGIESMDQCRHTLEQHNWNIEAAVQDRLNEQEGVPSVFNPPPSRPLQVNTADHRIYSYVVSRPQPRGLLGWGYYLIMLPFRFTYYTILDIFRHLMMPSENFAFFWFIFMEMITRTLMSSVVSQALRENTYPFLAMIMLKDRRMTVVGRLEGLIQPDDLINQLTFIMDANQTYLVSERLEREERNQTQVLRQQQDEAYLASLRADQEKERRNGRSGNGNGGRKRKYNNKSWQRRDVGGIYKRKRKGSWSACPRSLPLMTLRVSRSFSNYPMILE